MKCPYGLALKDVAPSNGDTEPKLKSLLDVRNHDFSLIYGGFSGGEFLAMNMTQLN